MALLDVETLTLKDVCTSRTFNVTKQEGLEFISKRLDQIDEDKTEVAYFDGKELILNYKNSRIKKRHFILYDK